MAPVAGNPDSTAGLGPTTMDDGPGGVLHGMCWVVLAAYTQQGLLSMLFICP